MRILPLFVAILLASRLCAQDSGDLGGRKAKAELKGRVLEVKPAEAAPGDTVVARVELSATEGWHFYGVEKGTSGVPTEFTATKGSVRVLGAVKEPPPLIYEKKYENGYLEKYTYHDGTIVFEVPLVLATDLEEGDLAFELTVHHMLCKEVCLQPTDIVVPGQLKVLPPRGADPDAVEPDDAVLAGKIVSVGEAKRGGTAVAKVELKVPRGYHIYGLNAGTSGVPTSFKVEEGPFKVGPGVKEPVPVHHYTWYTSTESVEEFDYHVGTVTFEVPLEVAADAKPGDVAFRLSVHVMMCTESMCLPESDTMLSGTVKVLEGEAVPPAVDPKKPVPVVDPGPKPAPPADKSFMAMLGLAFLGGLLLNVMPCVLPVLTLKLFGLVGQKNVTPGARRAGSLAYAAGVLLCLNGLALAVVILRSLGNQVGWGFQFQSPGFVIALTTLIFVFALSLLGVFEVPAMGTRVASTASRQHGWVGHLMTGLFVTIVATPCSAPFLGTGLGFALTLPAWGVFLFMSAAGLGLALPFLTIGFIPALFRFLPKPGPWLEPFERVMGFLLIATAVWLLDTIATLTGPSGVIGFLAFLTAVSFGAWVFGKWGSEVETPRSRLLSISFAVILSVVAGKMFLVTKVAEVQAGETAFRTEGLEYGKKLPWQPFNEENVAALRSRRKPGFIDFTADW
jgi:thiol:disulfide interchange protein